MRYDLLALMIVLLSGMAAAHTVTMNLAVRIGNNANITNNTIRINDTTYSTLAANSSAVLLMHLDNSTLDSSQYGNNGTISGGVNCTGVAGKINGACTFNGTNGYIFLPRTNMLDFGNFTNFTIIAWVNTSNSIANGPFIVDTRHSFGGTGPGYTLMLNSTGHPVLRMADGVSVTSFTNATKNITAGQWSMIAVSASRTNTTLFFVDGAQVGTANISSMGNISSTHANLYIGTKDGGSTNAFNGSIDEVIIYNTSLSADDVYNLYTYGLSEPLSLTFTGLNKEYISSSQRNTTAALVSAGTLLNIRLNNTYNSTHYLLQMTQDSSDNRFLIAATNATYSDIEDRLSMVRAFHMVSSTFGKFVVNAPKSFLTFIRLEYTNIDINNALEWSGIGQLRIKNNGLSRGIPNVTIELIT